MDTDDYDALPSSSPGMIWLHLGFGLAGAVTILCACLPDSFPWSEWMFNQVYLESSFDQKLSFIVRNVHN